MKTRLNLGIFPLPLMLGLVIALFAASGSPCQSQTTDAACSVTIDRWTRLFQDIEDKLNEFSAIQQTRVERIVQHPLPNASAGGTIAKQISDAMQVKEDMLNAKRRECREILGLEEKSFAEVQPCISAGRDSRNKELKKLTKTRNALIEKATVLLSEVKEVEGKDTGVPYTEAMQGQQDYTRGGASNYWQNYQQMYRRWWGY